MTDENYFKILNQYKVLKGKQKACAEAIKGNNRIAIQNVADDDTFFDEITDHFYGETETNNIYVYTDSYCWSKTNESESFYEKVEIPKDSNKKEGWNVYKNIERNVLDAYASIPRLEVKQFEEENIVLFAPKGVDTQEFYKLVRRTFFKYAIEFGQEEAVRKIKEEFATQSIEEPIKREREKKQ